MKALSFTAAVLVAALGSSNLVADRPAPQQPISLPDIGDTSGSVYSPADDVRLGQQFMRSLRTHLNFVDHPQVQSYVHDLGQRLVAATGDATRPFAFFVIDDPSVNAFAGPGGNIGIHSGLLLTSRTESELASVLAHEIAHVTQNHLARRFEAAEALSLPSAAALLAALVIGIAGGGEAGAAAAAAAQAGFVQSQINFTRANEQEADRIGFDLLVRGQFDAASMPVFFSRLQRANQIESAKVPEYLRTHPITSNRIADIEGRLGELAAAWVAPSLRFHLVRERLRNGVSTDPAEDVREYRDVLRTGRTASKTASRFGLALALMRAGMYSEAAKEVDALRTEAPDEIAFSVLAAEVLSKQSRFAEAAALLDQQAKLHPLNRELVLPLARAQLAAGKPKQARATLFALSANGRASLDSYRLLAQAEAEADNPALSHWYEAEVQFALGDTKAAVRQMDIAARIRGLPYTTRQKIEARRKEFKEILEAEELAKKQRG